MFQNFSGGGMVGRFYCIKGVNSNFANRQQTKVNVKTRRLCLYANGLRYADSGFDLTLLFVSFLIDAWESSTTLTLTLHFTFMILHFAVKPVGINKLPMQNSQCKM